MEVTHPDVEGNIHYIDFSLKPMKDEPGEVTFLLAEGRDITERKLAESALKRSEYELALRNRIAQVFLTITDEEMYGMVMKIVQETLESSYGIFGYISEEGDLVIPSLTTYVWDECRMQNKSVVFPPHTWGNALWGKGYT